MLEYEMQPLRKKPIRLPTLARQIATDFLNNGLDQGFTLEVEVLDERVQTIGDEKLLARAITNLVQNSIDHNPDGCRILLQTSFNKSNKTCSFIVIDNGRGIPEDQLPDLLELPYSSKRKFQSKNGHGLGLPRVARIAKAHRGFNLIQPFGKGLELKSCYLPYKIYEILNKPLNNENNILTKQILLKRIFVLLKFMLSYHFEKSNVGFHLPFLSWTLIADLTSST